MTTKQLVLALLLTTLIAVPQAWCCNSRSRADGDRTSSGRVTRVSGIVLLNPAPPTLPANARLEVRLQDISLMDAPSKLLTSTTVESVSSTYAATGGRIPFNLEAVIPEGTPYTPYSVSVSASLRGDGVSYITDTAFYVDLRQNKFDYRDMEITIVKYP